MTIFFERGAGPGVNIDSPVQRASQTNGSAARKFTAPDDAEAQDDRDSVVKTNDEHLVEQAASLKAVASFADTIASDARAAIDAARAQVSQTAGASRSDARPAYSSVTESDVAAQRALSAKQMASRIVNPLFDSKAIAHDLHVSLPDNVLMVRSTQLAPPAFNAVVPDIESVSVEMDRRKGSVDCFFARIKVTIPVDQVQNGNVKLIRIFRSTVINPIFQRGVPTVSMQGMARLASARIRSRTKNPDVASQLDKRLVEDGIPNAISSLTPIDPSTNLRTSARSAPILGGITNPNPDALIAASPAVLASQGFLNSPLATGLDRSVATDLKSLANLRIADPTSAVMAIPRAAVVNISQTRKTGLLNLSQIAGVVPDPLASFSINQNNSQGFREIATLTLDKLQSTNIGTALEYERLDDQVGFGKSYKYYVTTVDKNMIESSRSKIVEITVEGIRVPEMPREVVAHTVDGVVVLNAFVDDQLVEKFEVWRREQNFAQTTLKTMKVPTLAGSRGFNIDSIVSQRLDNGFIRIGDSLNGVQTAGSMFRDKSVRPGRGYTYRVFSVDVFGNKSEVPFVVQIFVPDPSSRPNSLLKPHISAQVDAKTNLIRLRFNCSDPRVASLFLGRRDLTIGQAAFTTPGGVNHIRLGRPKNAEGPTSFEGEVLRGVGADVSWTGLFSNNLRDTVFIDQTVSLDHVYQYKIYGVDRFGNRTSDDITPPLMVVRRPLIDAPVNLTARVVQGPNSTVGGISLSWQEGNITHAAEDYLGSQAALRDTAIRTLYQVERRKVGEELWVQFPLIPDLQFFDPSPSVLGRQFPGFRPPTVDANQSYSYRVQAVQTGAFVSNHSDPVTIFASLPLLAPENLRLRPSDANVHPAFIALNWDTPNNSAVVDTWDVERAVVNNLAAAKMNPRSSADFQKLSFSEFRTIHLESSRFRSSTIDPIRDRLVASATPSTVFTGQHHFQDMEVTLGNTYFYRIRAVGIDGTRSTWIYRGMKLTDASFEKRLSAVVSQSLREVLTNNAVPLITKTTDLLANADRSFALQPNFSRPSTVQPVLVGIDARVSSPGGKQAPSPTAQPTHTNSSKGLTGFKK